MMKKRVLLSIVLAAIIVTVLPPASQAADERYCQPKPTESWTGSVTSTGSIAARVTCTRITTMENRSAQQSTHYSCVSSASPSVWFCTKEGRGTKLDVTNWTDLNLRYNTLCTACPSAWSETKP